MTSTTPAPAGTAATPAARPEATPAVQPAAALRIAVDDLSGPDVAAFLAEHLRQMYEVSPPESVHALDLDALRGPDVTFWTVRDASEGAEGTLLGCGALKRLDAAHAELKSMRTRTDRRRAGIAGRLLEHILTEASRAGFGRVSLETGAEPFFAPARALYARFGFTPCAPFADYTPDPNSVFLTRLLGEDS